MKKFAIWFFVSISGCDPRGGIDEWCKPDGTCNPPLMCKQPDHPYNSLHRCVLPTDVMPSPPTKDVK